MYQKQTHADFVGMSRTQSHLQMVSDRHTNDEWCGRALSLLEVFENQALQRQREIHRGKSLIYHVMVSTTNNIRALEFSLARKVTQSM